MHKNFPPRPPLPIIAFSHVLRTCLELNLVWGVRSILVKDDSYRSVFMEQKTEIAVRQAYEMGLVQVRVCACESACISA